jgi:hypothetical protein
MISFWISVVPPKTDWKSLAARADRGVIAHVAAVRLDTAVGDSVERRLRRGPSLCEPVRAG